VVTEHRSESSTSDKEAYRKWAGRLSFAACRAILPAYASPSSPRSGCAVPRETVQPAMDYPPGAFYNRDGTPKVLPCMAGALIYPAR